MKKWILPAIAVGVAIFLMTESGHDLQEKFTDNMGDWSDKLMKMNHKAQEKLSQVQATLEHFSSALENVVNA